MTFSSHDKVEPSVPPAGFPDTKEKMRKAITREMFKSELGAGIGMGEIDIEGLVKNLPD